MSLRQSPLPRLNSPYHQPPAVTLSALHAPGKLVQQDHRDVAAGLVSDPKAMVQECSFTDSGGRASPANDLRGEARASQ
jgi:hypothetical protein